MSAKSSGAAGRPASGICPWVVSLACAGVLTLTGCATGSGSTVPSDSASPIASSGAEPTPTIVVSEPAPSPTETSTAVTPYNGEVLIVTAEVVDSRLEVTAMIPGVEESGGICRLDVIDQPVSASVSGNAGNDVTYCGVMSVTPEPASSWRFRVTYTSATTSTESAVSEVESAG